MELFTIVWCVYSMVEWRNITPCSSLDYLEKELNTTICSTFHYLSRSRVMFSGWKVFFFMFWHYRYDMLYYYKITHIILVVFGESGDAMVPLLVYKTWWKVGIHYLLSRLELLAIIPHGILCGLYYIPKGKHMLNSQH
jgi:hypothetical protein